MAELPNVSSTSFEDKNDAHKTLRKGASSGYKSAANSEVLVLR